MNRIRTKFVLAFLLIALLPVFPLYYLVKRALEESREIGLNERVENALEQAVRVSRQLHAKYREETLRAAEELAAVTGSAQALPSNPQWTELVESRLRALGPARLDLYDAEGDLLYTRVSAPEHAFPPISRNTLAGLVRQTKPAAVALGSDPSFLAAFAPLTSGGTERGFVVLTRALDETFTTAREQIVQINQMFKTFGFLESELTRWFLLSFFAVYVPIAGLSIALGYYFSRKITQPLLTLVDGTRKVAAGDWEHRVPVTSQDEVGQLVAAFNNMVSTLKQKQDQVIALEKMAAWREIARILAHEIKNPLTPIQLTVQQMKDQYPGDDPEYRRLLEECSEIVADEIESLRTLVREFSEFARMPKLNPAQADLNDLVQEVGKLYQERRLTLKLDSRLPEFAFDAEKLRRVLINLIENGLDAMREHPEGHLTVTTARQGDLAVLRVSDQGSGIPEALREKIFEPYFSTKKSGVGLGLAIVKRIVEEHGGRISLQSEVGRGTTFELTLPLQTQTA